MIATRRLYLTADRTAVVEEEDPRAALLLAAEGQEVQPADVERFALGKHRRGPREGGAVETK